MATAKISAKNQIVIPREAREALGVKPGDELLIVVRGDTLVAMPKPRSYRKAIRGMAKGVYPSDYVVKERQDWR